jgi:protein TonB
VLPTILPKKDDLFGRTLAVSLILHLVAYTVIILIGMNEPAPAFVPLAVMDFAEYDPEGGQGGGENIETIDPAPPEEVVPQEPEPLEEPEPFPELVESTAQEAPPTPPPPLEIKPPVIKPRVKPRPLAPESGPVTENLAGGSPGSGQGGTGGGTSRGNPDFLAAYKSQISRKLNRYKKYPTKAVANQLKGVTRVSFRLNPQGRISAVRIAASSGQPVLDEEALALLHRCVPFPPFPEKLGISSLELTVPINFSVRKIGS